MAIHATLRPNAVSIQNSWLPGGGAANVVSAVNDSNNATYASTLQHDAIYYNFPDIPALSAGELITHVRFVFSASMPVNVGGSVVGYLFRSDGGQYVSKQAGPIGPTVAETFVDMTTASGSLTTADVNGLYVAMAGWFSGESKVHEIRLDVYTNTPPTATFLASDPVTVTTVGGPGEPLRNWAYSDPDGDPQVQVHLKLFEGGATVPDPETEVARFVTDTGIINYSGTIIGVNAWPNGPYMVAIKVSDGTAFGGWSQRSIIFDLPVPEAPLLSATPDPANNRYAISLDDVSGTYPTEFFQVQRSENSGLTYVPVYGGVNVVFAGFPVVLYDYRSPRMARPYSAASIAPVGYNEAIGYNSPVGYNGVLTSVATGPLNVVRYRARAGRLLNGVKIWSAWTTITPANLVGDGTMWLKHPTDPAKSIKLQQLANWETTSEEDMSILRAAHRQDFVVFAGVASWKRGEMEFIFPSDAAYEAFESLRAPKTVVAAIAATAGTAATGVSGSISPAAPTTYLFQSCFGDTALEQVWMRLGPTLSVTRVTTGPQQHTNQYRRVKIGFVETKIPT